MGTWSRKLYGNDYARDIKDDCVLFLSYFQDGQKAYEKLLETYEKDFDDQEPIFWYAVADTMLKYGVLLPEVKEKALMWIENEGGIDLWEEVGKADRWRETLQELKTGLTGETPEPKKIPKYRDSDFWNIGDVNAIQITREKFGLFQDFRIKIIDDWDLFGKYFVFVKTGTYENKSRIPGMSEKTPIVRVYNKVFDHVPAVEELAGCDYMKFIKVKNSELVLHYDAIEISGYYRIRKNDCVNIGNIHVEKEDNYRSYRYKDVAEAILGEKEPQKKDKWDINVYLFYERAEDKYYEETTLYWSEWREDFMFNICSGYILSHLENAPLPKQRETIVRCVLEQSFAYEILTDYYYLLNDDINLYRIVYERFYSWDDIDNEQKPKNDEQIFEFIKKKHEEALQRDKELMIPNEIADGDFEEQLRLLNNEETENNIVV